MNNGWARLIILLFGDQHMLKGWEGSQDGPTNPNRVFPFWWSNDFNLHWKRSHIEDLPMHSFRHSWVHGVSSWEDYVVIEGSPDFKTALFDGVIDGFSNSNFLHSEINWNKNLAINRGVIHETTNRKAHNFVWLLSANNRCALCQVGQW